MTLVTLKMTHQYWIGFVVVLAFCIYETASLPAQSELMTEDDMEVTDFLIENNLKQSKEDNFLIENQTEIIMNKDTDATKEILDKILAVNKGLKKPFSDEPTTKTNKSIKVLKADQNTLDTISKLLATGKLQPFLSHIKDVDNFISNDFNRFDNSRAMNGFADYPQNMILQNPVINPTSLPYITNLPVVVLPQQNYNNMYSRYPLQFNDGINNPDFSSSMSPMSINAKQSLFPNIPFLSNLNLPSFSIPWPLAPFFPILIKDPLVGLMQGGGLNNFIEYGQQADVCSRKQKSTIPYNTNNLEEESNDDHTETSITELSDSNIRKSRAIKNSTIKATIEPSQSTSKKINKVYLTKPVATKAPVKQYEEDNQTKYDDGNGDLRFPFGDFGWFGNKKPVAPSPGFFINKLRVRKGGVAIAGPGGVATAGRGGTAIVGPGGFAYTKPGSLAVAGPAARIFALSPDADLNDVVSRIQSQNDSSRSLLQTIPEGKLIATGPIVFYHPNEKTELVEYLPFYGGAKGQYLAVKKDSRGTIIAQEVVSEDSISSDVIKNTEETVLSKVLGANLKRLQNLSGSLLKLYNLGKNTGGLNSSDKNRFSIQLASLGEAASSTTKIVEEIGDNVNNLFTKISTKSQSSYDVYDEIEEEGVGVDNPDQFDDQIMGGALIAEAKPVGLAVIGQSGTAASRPHATAVAMSGLAVAQPVATAIAGIDPTILGIDYQAHKNKEDNKKKGKK